jgi:hypothetical protein
MRTIYDQLNLKSFCVIGVNTQAEPVAVEAVLLHAVVVEVEVLAVVAGWSSHVLFFGHYDKTLTVHYIHFIVFFVSVCQSRS